MPGIFTGWRQRRKARMIAQQVAKLPGSRRRMAIAGFCPMTPRRAVDSRIAHGALG